MKVTRRVLNLITVGALLAVVCIAFYLRYLVIFQYPYPSGNDAGGELYTAHSWLGNSLPNVNSDSLVSPIYEFLVVIPFTSIFSPFLGIKLYIIVLPAILGIPEFLLLREIGLCKITSIVGAFLLSFSSSYSLMLTWNAGVNIFAIFLMIFFLLYLVKAFKYNKTKHQILASLFLSLIVGSHILTAVVSVITFFVTVTLISLKDHSNARAHFRVAGKILLFSLISCSPYFYSYIQYLFSTTNVGIGSFTYNIYWSYEHSILFAWGFQSLSLSMLSLFDLIISIVAIVFVLYTFFKSDYIFASVMFANILAALSIPILVASNAVRGLYFLPVPIVTMVMFTLDRVLINQNKYSSHNVKPKSPNLFSRGILTLKNSQREDIKNSVRFLFLVICIIIMVIPNTVYSSATLKQADTYYMNLSPDKVNALNWIRYNTPSNAVLFDSLGLQTWIEGYAGRLDYTPQPLYTQVTNQSLNSAFTSEMISMGTYILGNNYFVEGNNFPGKLGTPSFYLFTPIGWQQLMKTQTNSVIFDITINNTTYQLNLGEADLKNLKIITSNVTSSLVDYTYYFGKQNIWLYETDQLVNSKLTINWYSNNSVVDKVSLGFAIPPSGYFFQYIATNISRTKSVSTYFTSNGISFNVSFSSGSVSQVTEGNGWTYLTINTSKLNQMKINITSNNYQVGSTYAYNTLTFLKQLNVSYVLTGGYSSFSLKFDSCFFGNIVNSTLVYNSKSIQIYHLNYI